MRQTSHHSLNSKMTLRNTITFESATEVTKNSSTNQNASTKVFLKVVLI